MKSQHGMTIEAIIKAAAKVYRVEPADMMSTTVRGTPVLARCIAVHVAKNCYKMSSESLAWKFGTTASRIHMIAARAESVLRDSPQTVRDAEAVEVGAIAIMAKRQQARQDVIRWRAETAQHERVS